MCNRALMWVGALTAAGVLGQNASAAYTGLTVERHATVSISGTSCDVFRVYVNFSDPGDRLVIMAGSPNLGPLTVQTRNFNDTGAGNAFYNSPLDRITAPSAAIIGLDANEQWDTFVTLGVSITDQSPFGDMTLLTPGFTGISGTSTTYTNGAWFTSPTFDHDNDDGTPEIAPPQTVAGWTGDGDDLNRVLMMQLTVQAGENVRGTVNVGWYQPLGGPFQTVTQVPLQSFNSFVVPAPSALALLGLAGLVAGSRRRRAR